MKHRVRLSVDQLEARTTPSAVSSTGAFLPPGIVRFFAETSAAPPPVQAGRDGSSAFLPPGIIRFFAETSAAPPPAQVGRDGSVVFVPPGVIKGWPDPSGFIAAANE